jgi:acyl dehydratase
MVTLRVRTVDQRERLVLDFWRCAMLPMRDDRVRTGHADELDAIPSQLDNRAVERMVSGWRMDGSDLVQSGVEIEVEGGDVVTGAAELARLTLNIARAHHDSRESGQRLVYGGHTIGIAASQACRALPRLLTIVGWHSCQHLAPVFENDTLTSTVLVERTKALGNGGELVHVRSQTTAHRGGESRPVLDWKFVAVASDDPVLHFSASPGERGRATPGRRR